MFCDSFFVLLLFVSVVTVECKTCESMDIRNSVHELKKLRNCTEIVGNLKIVLIEKCNEYDYEEYVFPELTKITGYLFFFKVVNLTSIARLFPNLTIIRGYELFTDYSLVLYEMPHLREIGTEKLMYISRGLVKIDKCPQLCYANTIDWKTIGTKVHFTNLNNGTCDSCPVKCDGYCWNIEKCQEKDTDKCHPECLGCYQSNSARHCRTCRNSENDGTCVSECKSSNKFRHGVSYKCVSEEQCRKMLNGTWWVHDDACVNDCPQQYERVLDENKRPIRCRRCNDICTRWCKSTPIESIDRLQNLKGCTHINGSLVIRWGNMEEDTMNEFKQHLGSVTYIRDSLVVTRSNAIKSMEFLQNLTVIEGERLENKRYAVYFYENQNLQKLWDFNRKNFTLKIKNGKLAFYNNPQLCPSEIRTLAEKTGIPSNFSTLDVYSNGDKSNCNFIQINVTVNMTVKNATLSWKLPPPGGNDTYILFTVYYIEHANESVSISTYESKDVCDSKGWKSQFTMNNSIVLHNLTPYTRYAYYIKTYLSSKEGAQTNVSYFVTLPDDPEMPQAFTVTAIDHQTIKLSWSPPRSKNGVLKYYKLYGFIEPNFPIYAERDFCVHPRTAEGEKIDAYFEEPESDPDNTTITNKTDMFSDTCPCPKKEEIRFFMEDAYYSLCDREAQSKFGIDKCKHLLYEPFEPERQKSADSILLDKRQERHNTVKKAKQRSVLPNSFDVKIPAEGPQEYHLKRLRHFTLYIFYFKACNEGDMCGPVALRWKRTKKLESADDIEFVEHKLDNTDDVIIEWSEPKNPNAAVLSYNIVYNRTDSEHSKPTTECVSRSKREPNKVILANLQPGMYEARVQTVSLAGPGKFSRPVSFEISAPAKDSAWIMTVISIAFIVMAGAFFFYLKYKRKRKLDNIHLIATINPDYDGTVYVEDEWEVDRSDIELLYDLGHGTFGTVYCGMIKSRKISCAIKTVNENISLHNRMEFLNEASVMKSFSNSHHVVKLMGVVSKGQPPLVIMELMERGDLKKYLRRTRDSSQNITANEIYRMSIEIADGMAYLAAKKFVHRDLAARNCMVGFDRTVKIGDFGMARDIYETDYYRKETKGLLPVRWMAPESLADGVFTSDSDVWSYGIVLWEIATLAEQPYQGLSNEQVLQFIVSKGRLERPQECPDLLYEIMDACWCWRPNDRPTFADIVERLEDHVGQDFKLVSFIHSREGLEHRMNHSGERAYNPPALGMGAEEHDLYGGGQYHASDEEVSLYVGDSSRPRFLPSSLSQRHSRFSPSDSY